MKIALRKTLLIVLCAVVLIGSVAALVLVNIGGLVLDTAIDEALASLSESENPSGASGSAGTETQAVPGADTAPEGGSVETESPLVPEVPEAPAGAGGSMGGDKTGGGENGSEAGPAGEGESEAKPSATPSEKPLVTAEEAQRIKEKITAEDKIAVSTMVLSKLSASDIEYLTGLLAGGLTPSEKTAAKELCYERFNAEEIAKIRSFYEKYTSS